MPCVVARPIFCLLAMLATQTACVAGQLSPPPVTAKLPKQSSSTWFDHLPSALREGDIGKDSKVFAEWLEAVAEPRAMTALGAVLLEVDDPGQAIAANIDPAAIRNWAEFTDPYLHMRWMLANGSPSLQRAIIGGNPDKRGFVVKQDSPAMLDSMGRLPSAWMKAANPGNCLPMARMLLPITHWNGFGKQPTGSGKAISMDREDWFMLTRNKESGSAAPRYRY